METGTEEQAKKEPEVTAASPLAAAMHWYVVHTYSGYEQKARAALEQRLRSPEFAHLKDRVGEVLVPVESVQELGKGGQRRVSVRKFFPGYIFVHMVLDEETWHFIKNTPKVTGFVGHATQPPEVPESEVREITQQMEEGARGPSPRYCSRWARR